MGLKNIYLVVPVFNESKYVASFTDDLVSKIHNIPQIKKVIFVNDGSTDTTLEILKALLKKHKQLSLISHKTNLGKGEAMRTGLSISRKEKAGAVIYMDGDKQHDPKFLNKFLTKLENTPVVFGYRQLSKNSPIVRRTGNKVAGLIIHNLFGIKRKDLLCGFMAIREDVFGLVTWESKGYGVEAELSASIGRKKIKFSEVLVSTIYLDRTKGVSLRHAFFILLKLPKWYLFVSK